jgi:hypothetical protein
VLFSDHGFNQKPTLAVDEDPLLMDSKPIEAQFLGSTKTRQRRSQSEKRISKTAA